MKILAIETSCDETSIAIVDFSGSKQKPDIRVFSHIISSQLKLHAKFGGVVPNLARREHQKNLPIVLIRALKEGRFSISNFQNSPPRRIHGLRPSEAKTFASDSIFKKISNRKLKIIEKILEREQELFQRFKKEILPLPMPGIDAIAVTVGPGLAPALWVGVNFARALAVLWSKPIIPVNHMEGHIYSIFAPKGKNGNFQFPISNFQFPAVALLVSGGHTELVLMRGHGKYKIIGETLDDAAGEAFDKVARMLDLGYPGGPEISKLAQNAKLKAQNYNPKLKISLPRPMLSSNDYNFSFSGLKTAVLYLIRDLKKQKQSIAKLKPTIAREFEQAVVDVLVAKTIRAAREHDVKTVILAGGVAANNKLRKTLKEKLEHELPNAHYFVAPQEVTGDNALMIALAAFFTGKKKSWIKIAADANLRLDN